MPHDRAGSALRHIPALDGIRGLAVLGVIGRHLFHTPHGGGYGVDVFFVLSGFLITTLLLEEHERTQRISLRGFYRRRALRLLPALAVMLAAFLLAEALRDRLDEGLRAGVWGAFYTANVAQAWFPHEIGRLPIGPLWSLAQEEQFYLIAPLLLVVLLRRRVTEVAMMRVFAAAFVVAAIEIFALALRGAPQNRIYAGPDTHSTGLFLGMTLAFALRSPQRRDSARLAVTLGPASFLLLAAVSVDSHPFHGMLLLANFAAAGLIACVVCQPIAPASRLLALPPLVGVGRISYALYLWNTFYLWLLGGHGWLALAATFATSVASYRFVELRFLRMKRPAARPSPMVSQATAPAPRSAAMSRRGGDMRCSRRTRPRLKIAAPHLRQRRRGPSRRHNHARPAARARTTTVPLS